MFNFLANNAQNQIENVFSFMPIILGLFGIFFVAIVIFIVVVIAKNIKGGKKPHVFRYNNHEIQVLVSMTRVEIFYEGKIIDEIALSSNTVGARFNEILDGVHYKINIGYSGITPSVVVFADNEKLSPIK